MKIIEILYITSNPVDMAKYDLIKADKLNFKKEIKDLNALVFEDNISRKIYYIQNINTVLKFIKYRLFDEILNIKLIDKSNRIMIKQSLR